MTNLIFSSSNPSCWNRPDTSKRADVSNARVRVASEQATLHLTGSGGKEEEGLCGDWGLFLGRFNGLIQCKI